MLISESKDNNESSSYKLDYFKHGEPGPQLGMKLVDLMNLQNAEHLLLFANKRDVHSAKLKRVDLIYKHMSVDVRA